MVEASSQHEQRVTVLDVLENYFGDTPTPRAFETMEVRRIDELGEVVCASAQATLDIKAYPGTVYPGGFLAGQWHDENVAEYLHLALLYYPQLLVHDPLADYFFSDFEDVPEMRPLRSVDSAASVQSGPAIWGQNNTWRQHREDPDRARAWLTSTVQSIVTLAPIIRTGVLVLRSQWPTIVERQAKLMVSVASDVKATRMQRVVDEARRSGEFLPTWDYLWGGGVTVGSAVAERDTSWINQNEFFHLAKTLAVADRAGATYMPPGEAELRLLRAKSDQAIRKLRKAPPIELLCEVARVLVPDMALTAETAIAMRTSDENFDDWRRQLRLLSRDAADDAFDDLRERVADRLLPVRRRILQQTSRSIALKSAFKEQSATAVITCGTASIATALAGANPGVAIASGLGSGVLQWLWKAYRPPVLGGSDAVAAALIRTARPR